MSKNIKTSARHGIFYQFMVSIVLVIVVMIGVIVFMTNHLLSKTDIDTAVLTELIVDEIIIGSVLLAVAVLVISLIVKRIVKPVEALSRALQKLATGDLEVSIDYRADNELGQLARDFDALRDVLYRQSLDRGSSVKFIKSGTETSVYVNSEQPCKTFVKDVTADGKILIFSLVRQGKAVELKNGQKLKLYCYPEGGRNSVIAEVEGTVSGGGDTLVRLNPLSEPFSEQRRKAYRVDRECEAAIRRSADDESKNKEAKVKNISAEGALVHVNEDYAEGEKLFLRVTLPVPGERPEVIESAAAVIWKGQDTDVKKIGVQFSGFEKDSQTALMKFIMANQAK